MGIEKFFYTMAKMSENGIQMNTKTRFQINHLYIDFNSILYKIGNEIDKMLGNLLYAIIIKDINKFATDTAEKTGFLLTDATPESFNQYFSQLGIIDNVTIQLVKEYLIEIIKNHTTGDDLKTIFLAVDGVPQMSKIIEQKKRKYNGYLTSELQKKISNHPDYAGKIPHERLLFEKYKVGADRGKITTWGGFMDIISENLQEPTFLLEINKVAKNITSYIVSGPKFPGEGEKKIMEHILSVNNHGGNYMFYSPDADTILLGMLGCAMLNNTNFIMLRYNQQSRAHDHINVNIFIADLIGYISTKIQKEKKVTRKNIIYDLVVIFTLFGNDFVPKMESIDVRHNTKTLIDTYCSLLNDYNYMVILRDDGIFDINYLNLYNYLIQLASIENRLLAETYLENECQDYKGLKNLFGVDEIFEYIEKYTKDFNDYLAGTKPDINFMKYFNSLENLPKEKPFYINTKYVQTTKSIRKTFYRNNENYGNFRIREKNYKLEDTEYLERLAQENLPHAKMLLTDLDIELMRLEKKIGKYSLKFNAEKSNLGKMQIVYDNERYQIEYPDYYENILEFYKKNFGIVGDSTKVSYKFENNELVQLNNIIDEYLQGIMWVFDFYFNKNNQQNNAIFVSGWFYSHHRAPLLTDIVKRLKLFKSDKAYIDYMENLRKTVQLLINRENYINAEEQLMYSSPAEYLLKKMPYRAEIINAYPEIFVKLSHIVNKISENKSNSDVIDCTRISYLNKCNLIGLKNVSFLNYYAIVSRMNKRIIPEAIIPENLWKLVPPQRGGMTSTYYKNYYKKLYLDTKNIEFKKLYKKYKHM